MMIIVVALVGLVGYLAMSQASIPRRIRRVFSQRTERQDEPPALAPRPNAQWEADPDRTNEARELERVTGVIRKGEGFTIVTNDPSPWAANDFELQGIVTAVAEVQTVDASGNFQFRYCTVDMQGPNPNTLILEGDSPTGAVAYLGRAYGPEDSVDGVRAGQIISRIQEERSRYRTSGAAELATELPVYEAGTIIAARYQGSLALLEHEPGAGYLPVSAANPQGAAYGDVTVRLDPSGWLIRLVEVGAYAFLLELEPVKLSDLT